MSQKSKKTIHDTLVSMGFQPNYITRAFKVYEKNYGYNYNVEVITEIIVRLQNKDKLKQKKAADKDKSPQPQSSPSKSKTKTKPKPKENSNKKQSKPPPPKQSKSPSKSSQSKPIKSKQSKPSQNESKPSKNNKKVNMGIAPKTHVQKPPKMKQNSPNMKTEPPPKPYVHTHAHSHANYAHGSHGQAHNNLSNIGAMNRSQSGGHGHNKQKRKPNKPPPHNPLPQQPKHSPSYNGNNIHNQSPFKPSRPSPSPPHRFKAHDVVIYNGQEAEIMKIYPNFIEITYPISKYIMHRQRAKVPPQQIQQKKKGYIPSQVQQSHQYNQSQPYNPSPHRHSPPRYPHAHAHSQSQSQTQSKSPNGPPQHAHVQQQPKATPPPQKAKTKTKPKTKTNTANQNQNQSPLHNNITVTAPHSNNNEMPSFVSHMCLEEANKLKIHEKIDHRDQVGRFVYATVSEKQGCNLKIHYDGWSRKWDTWSDFSMEIHRFAYAGSISKRPSHRFRTLKKGDYVDINPTQRHPGWKCGEIRRLDQKSGQVQVVYESLDKNYLYWAHLDNHKEIAEFTSKSGTVHQTQMEIIKKTEQPKKEAAQAPQKVSPVQKVEPMDEMEAYERIRAKRFPRYPNEVINNHYGIGDWLEVQDTQTHQWITATVIDKENNWIVVHFDGWPSKYDQKIHAVKHKKRLRDLGSGLQETQEEKDIKEEMANFLCEVEQLNWKLIEVDADGNCLYRCFAINIYDDTTKHMDVRQECCSYMRGNERFFSNFIPDFDQRMKEKEQEYEWGDHVDITALSELYNVRVRVFEYDRDQKKLYMSFDQGEHEETVNLPLILLARHRKKHYNIITDPQAVHNRPLKTAQERQDSVSLKELRLKEDAQEEEEKARDDEKESGNDMNDVEMRVQSPQQIIMSMNNSMSLRNVNSGLLNNYSNTYLRNILLQQEEFVDVLETWNLSEPLGGSELKNIFMSLINKIYKKIEFQIQNNHKGIVDAETLNRFWKHQFEQEPQCQNNCKRWINALKEKIPNGQFPSNACVSAFNQTIVASITDNLGSIIESSRKRQSIDVNRQQPMDIDQ